MIYLGERFCRSPSHNAINGGFGDMSCKAAIGMPHVRGNVASAITAGAQGRFVRTAVIQHRPKNPPFWHASKSPGFTLPKTPFKTQVVVEPFCPTCDHKNFACDHMQHVFALTDAIFMIYEHLSA